MLIKVLDPRTMHINVCDTEPSTDLKLHTWILCRQTKVITVPHLLLNCFICSQIWLKLFPKHAISFLGHSPKGLIMRHFLSFHEVSRQQL